MSPIAPISPFERHRRLANQRGASLIELMIGMLISLLLIGGMVTLFINNKQTYRYNEELARIQENGRFAIEFLQRSFRQAGHLGCAYMVPEGSSEAYGGVTPKSTAIIPAIDFNQTTAVSAYVHPPTGTDVVASFGQTGVNGTEVITIIFGSGASANLVTPAASGAPLVIDSNALGYRQGEALIVANCRNADIFRVSNVPASGNNVTLEHQAATIYNSSDDLAGGATYNTDARVMRLQIQSFYLAPSARLNRQGQPIQSLYVNGGEMIEGVVAMRAMLGLPAGGVPPGPNSRVVANYVPVTAMTADDWADVIAIQFELLLASPDDNAVSAPMPMTFNGVTSTAPDRRMYSTVSTTIALRNRF